MTLDEIKKLYQKQQAELYGKIEHTFYVANAIISTIPNDQIVEVFQKNKVGNHIQVVFDNGTYQVLFFNKKETNVIKSFIVNSTKTFADNITSVEFCLEDPNRVVFRGVFEASYNDFKIAFNTNLLEYNDQYGYVVIKTEAF